MKGETREIRIKKISAAAFHKIALGGYVKSGDEWKELLINKLDVCAGDYVVLFNDIEIKEILDVLNDMPKKTFISEAYKICLDKCLDKTGRDATFKIVSGAKHLYSKRNWFYSKDKSIYINKKEVKKVYEIV